MYWNERPVMKHVGIFTFVLSPVFIASATGVVLLHLKVIDRFSLTILVVIGVAVSLIHSILVAVFLSRH